MYKNEKIYVAGHTGMVGSAIVRELQKQGFENLILKNRQELDLLNQDAVQKFFADEKPEYVILAAARVGGIKANMSYPAEFLFENLQIQNNVIWSAHKSNIKKLLFLGSSCVYPRNCPQPMKEEYFMDGKVEPTNEGYAVAKISGMELCRMISKQFGKNFVSCMPTNIYGENDNFDPESSHVIPALIRKFHQAKVNNLPEVSSWGTGSARREFLHVDDLAKACLFLMENFNYTDDNFFVNVGTGEDISIKELTDLIVAVIGYQGNVTWDQSRPDGMPRKLLDVLKLTTLGWKYQTDFKVGLASLYEWFKKNIKD